MPARADGSARSRLLTGILLAGTAFFLVFVNQHYPIWRWMFWRYAAYWLSGLLACGSFLALGHMTITRVLGRTLRPFEHLTVAFVLGLFEFEILMFLAGLCQLFHWPLFFAMPALCLGVGGRSLYRYLRTFVRHARGLSRRGPRLGLFSYAMIGFGVVGLLMIYFSILSPENVEYDARWKHLRIAEEFFVHGGFRVYPEGWTFASRPHMTSYVYLWTFLLPGALPFDQVVNAAHIEFFIFLFTTVFGIAAVVRRLLPNADPRVVWVARFLFPGVFLYDSSLAGGADHVGGAFCVPIFILTLEAFRTLNPRFCLLLALSLSGAALVKDTNAYMLLPPAILCIALRTFQFAVGWPRIGLPPRTRFQWLRGPAVATLGCLLFTTPQWLKNWIAYGNPIYPAGSSLFSPRPWTADAADVFTFGYQDAFWSPPRTLWGLGRTLQALVDWSFIPNDWSTFHGQVPVIGSLFTLLLACLPFLRRTGRIWFLVAWIHLAILCWYVVHHQDRYLQSIMPWIAAATAAMLGLLWQQRKVVVRAALSLLVGIQIVWGADVYFMQTHAMARSPIKKAVDVLAAGSQRKYNERFAIGQDIPMQVGEAVPRGSRVLVHERHNFLGMRAESVSDHTKWQFGISYGLLDSPADVYAILKSMGVTHLWWRKVSAAHDTIAGDLMFFDFANRFSVDKKTIGDTTLAAMPPVSPAPTPRQFNDTVAVLGCDHEYKTGLYRVPDFRVAMWGPRRKEYPSPRTAAADAQQAVTLLRERANYVLVDPDCVAKYDRGWEGDFSHMFKRKRPNKNVAYDAYIRNAPLPAP